MRFTGFALLVLLLALPHSRGFAAGAEPVRLVTPLAYGTHLPGLGDSAAKLAKLVEERSAGALILDLKQPGDGTKPHEILDKVSAGIVDAGFATASLWAAKIPAASLFSGFPFGPDASEYLAWFERGNGRKLYQEMYDSAGLALHVMPCAFGGAESGGWFTKEIGIASDIKGLRMRIFGLGASVMSRLGATTVLMPGGDLAAAFAADKIDAAELYTPAVDEGQALKDRVKLIYVPGWQQPETVLELLINKDRWEKLSEPQRNTIGEACLANLKATLADNPALQARALANLTAMSGVWDEQWPGAVLSALRSAWGEIATEEGNQDYFFKTVLDDIAKFRAGAQKDAAPAPPPPTAARGHQPAGDNAAGTKSTP
jgi:TRAP-type mannitol/chloroaromatic compound transport system substrate-binding protein